MCVCVCVYIYTYIYIYIYICLQVHNPLVGRRLSWPLQEIRFISRIVCTHQYYYLQTPPLCGHPTHPPLTPALLHTIQVPPNPLYCNVYNTLLVMAISCNGLYRKEHRAESLNIEYDAENNTLFYSCIASRRPLPVFPRPPSGIDTSRCWARQCWRTGETPVFCTGVCVCVTRETRLSLVPLDAAVTPVTYSLLYEYSNLEYLSIYVIYRGSQAEYDIQFSCDRVTGILDCVFNGLTLIGRRASCGTTPCPMGAINVFKDLYIYYTHTHTHTYVCVYIYIYIYIYI